MISCGCSPRKSRRRGRARGFGRHRIAPRYIIGRTRITMVAQVLLAASLSFLTTPPPALLSLAAFSQRAASVVRSPGSTRVADHECWDLAALLFTMARTPVADHQVAPP